MRSLSRPVRAARRVAMTPLIDIVFILLLFFILETSFTEFRQLWLPLPESTRGAASETRPLELQLFPDGRIWTGGRTLERGALEAYLREMHYASDTVVVLELHSDVSLQSVVDVCDSLHARGLHGIDIRGLDEG